MCNLFENTVSFADLDLSREQRGQVTRRDVIPTDQTVSIAPA